MIIYHIYLSAEYRVFTYPLVNLQIKPYVDQWRPVTDYCEHLGLGLPRWLQGHRWLLPCWLEKRQLLKEF